MNLGKLKETFSKTLTRLRNVKILNFKTLIKFKNQKVIVMTLLKVMKMIFFAIKCLGPAPENKLL